ncbi:MAG: SRPBCC family protein [Acidimicrobiales bacterium]
MRIENTLHIDAAVERIWELTLDVEAWPTHTPTMTSVKRVDQLPLAVGSAVRIKQPGQRERVWTVSALEPGRRFAWSTQTMGTAMTGAHTLTATPSGTTQTLSVDIEGKLSRLVGAILRRPIAKAIAAENLGFKAAAEATVKSQDDS